MKAKPIPTGLAQLDRVLGKGLRIPSVTMIAGCPGSGKSTLALKAACGMRPHLPAGSGPALYVSSEERIADLHTRAKRIEVSLDGVELRSCINLDGVECLIEEFRPSVLVVDSMQSMHLPLKHYDGRLVPFKVSDLLVSRYAFDVAHRRKMAVLVVGHTLRDGSVPSARTLSPLFDKILLLRIEPTGMRQLSVLGEPAVKGMFEMRGNGIYDAATA